jgi:subfamily B ATP-binding cassette protein MsbA
LYTPDRGSIEIDGVSAEKITIKSLRGLFGLVSQDIFLFHDTIKENMTLGHEYAPEKIEKAMEVAHAKSFIEELSFGPETLIGDRGVRLSGGQQQRLTIARAFLQETDILLFDEATSALDNQSERIVQQALNEISRDKTVVAVAHRLSTIQGFDKIYVLSEGELVETGTHEQLLAKRGEYFKLYQLGQQ